MRTPAFRLALLVSLVGCGPAKWSALVKYSDRPAPSSEGLTTGVYVAVLTRLAEPKRPRVARLRPQQPIFSGQGMDFGQHRFPFTWPDSLRRATLEALADTAARRSATIDILTPAFERAQFTVLSDQDSSTVASRSNLYLAEFEVPLVHRSRPGFNHDSTIAVVHVDYLCGSLCGFGSTFVLARRAGFEWHVWHEIGLYSV